MRRDEQVIVVHRDAPAKPDLGHPCNGCGVCCLTEPCPVGRLIFLRWRGACPALQWQGDEARYICSLAATTHVWLRRLPRGLRGLAGRFFARAIAAGQGCDADMRVA